jgi:hypothetical protein
MTKYLAALFFIMALGEVHARPALLVSYWHTLDEQCRGGSGDDEDTIKTCNERSDLSAILINQGCSFRYPDGWPELHGEYWKCHKDEAAK